MDSIKHERADELRTKIKSISSEKFNIERCINSSESNMLGSEVRKEIIDFIRNKYNPIIQELQKEYTDL